MTKVLVLMKAMPPTTGHRDLIQFAEALGETTIVFDTAPDEPMIEQRWHTLFDIKRSHTRLVHLEKAPQDTEEAGFWDWWSHALNSTGKYDYVVASEPYGKRIAELVGARFMPYDIDRELNPAKGTLVRNETAARWSDIVQEFRPNLKTVVSTFGAESTGKTTLVKALAKEWYGDYIFEYARPYLTKVDKEINIAAMTDIWHGQEALQRHAFTHFPGQVLLQDTDLWLTVGYWEQPHWHDVLGDPPKGLISAARKWQSDLYLFTPSNIPFEEDEIRYAGDHRESPDEYWLALAEKYELPYVVLDSPRGVDGRMVQALQAIEPVRKKNLSKIFYDRQGR